MEGLGALLAVMYYVLTIVYLSLFCFIAMLCTNMVVIRFQKSKYVVKRVNPEIDGEYSTPLIGNSCLREIYETNFLYPCRISSGTITYNKQMVQLKVIKEGNTRVIFKILT
jgi:hypothetical protein